MQIKILQGLTNHKCVHVQGSIPAINLDLRFLYQLLQGSSKQYKLYTRELVQLGNCSIEYKVNFAPFHDYSRSIHDLLYEKGFFINIEISV